MNVSPSNPSWRPSAPIPSNVGVYKAPRTIPMSVIYVMSAALFLFAVAFTVYLLLTGGQ